MKTIILVIASTIVGCKSSSKIDYIVKDLYNCAVQFLVKMDNKKLRDRESNPGYLRDRQEY